MSAASTAGRLSILEYGADPLADALSALRAGNCSSACKAVSCAAQRTPHRPENCSCVAVLCKAPSDTASAVQVNTLCGRAALFWQGPFNVDNLWTSVMNDASSACAMLIV